MRFWPGLMLLLPLASLFAHAELIDEVNDRGELRVALSADLAPFSISLNNALQRIKADSRLAALSQKWLERDAIQP